MLTANKMQFFFLQNLFTNKSKASKIVLKEVFTQLT